MAFTDDQLKHIEFLIGGYCKRLTKPEIADQLNFSYEISGHAVTIYENRPPWRGTGDWTHHGVARFRYFKSRDEWALYWMRADLKWHFYEPAGELSDLNSLFEIVKSDDYCCFFG